MKSVQYVAKYLSSCVAMLAITGCATISFPEPEAASNPVTAVIESQSDDIIAQDFVNIMVQIEALSPLSTSLRFGQLVGNALEKDERSVKTGSPFGKALRVAAQNGGYALETAGSDVVEDSSGSNFVSFSIVEFGDAVDGTTYTFDVSVGDIDFRRVYKPLDSGGIEPFNSMLVRGADVSQLKTDDSIFATSASNQTKLAPATAPPAKPATTVAFAKNEQLIPRSTEPVNDSADDANIVVAKNEPVSVDRSSTPVFERPVTIAAPLIADLPAPAFNGSLDNTIAQSLVGGDSPSDFNTIRKINIADTGESNYHNLLLDKLDVAEQILVFGDDSYVLGARNKQMLTDMMGKFDPNTDVVSVIGCSTGVTKIANGNAALAIGRANRVKEALMYSGVPHDKIFDEGCWSPTANSTPFPNRGVVVTVKRTANEG